MDNSNPEMYEDYPIVPDGYDVCWVSQLDDGQFKKPKTYLLYADDSVSISVLIEQYIKNMGIKGELTRSRKIMHFSFGKSKLEVSESMTLRKIKEKLNNYTLKTFELNPYLTKVGQLIPECSKEIQIMGDENFRDISKEQNKIEVSLVLPQTQNHFFNTKLKASDTLQEALRQFLKENANTINHKLQRHQMTVKCLTCNDESPIDLKRDVKDVVSDSHSLQVRFEGFGREIQWREFIKTEIRFHDLEDKFSKVYMYERIKEYKVKNIVKMLNRKQNRIFGLRILGNVLKPEQRLSSVHSHIIVKENQVIDAYLVLESEFFYKALPYFKDHTFLFEKQETRQRLSNLERNTVQNFYRQRQTRLSQIDTSIHKDAAFFDPIFGYTSPHFFRELNDYLRNLNFPSLDEKNYLKEWFLKFTYCLITSLFKLPNYEGIVYRGQRVFDETSKLGQIICFKNFTSSSMSKSKAFQFGRNTLYVIRSLSGKSIGNFSYYKTEAEVLFLPHSYFKVVKVNRTKQSCQIELEELPSPRKRDSNLLLWVDDNAIEGNKIYRTFIDQHPQIKTELIQLLSNDQLETWLKYFGFHIQNPEIKVSAITDMKRGLQQLQAGIQTIKMLRKVLPKINILVFVGDEIRTKAILEKNRMILNEHLEVGNKSNVVRGFIKTKVLREQETKEDQCQLI